jgi:hypothetical protein
MTIASKFEFWIQAGSKSATSGIFLASRVVPKSLRLSSSLVWFHLYPVLVSDSVDSQRER